MKYRIITIVAAVFLIAVSGLASADILPKPVPENQLFTMDSIIEAVGPVSEKTTVVWQVGDAGLTALAQPRFNAAGTGIESGSIAYVTYGDSIVTNGGQISEVKSFSMSTASKTEGLYNIETSKVLTYTSQNGSHLMGEESYVLDVAGDWRWGLDGIVCVFSRNTDRAIPAFCNKVTASSKLTQITTAQVETIGGVTAVSDDDSTPAALKYEISVAPDSNSASGYADGIVSTTFTVSVMEGRSDGAVGWYQCAAGMACNTLANWVGPNGLVQMRFVPVGAASDWAGGVVDQGDQLIILVNGRNAGVITFGAGYNGGLAPFINPDVAMDGGALRFIDEFLAMNGLPPVGVIPGAQLAGMVGTFIPATWDGTRDLTIPTGGYWTETAPTLANSNELASRLTYIDSATVSGGISTFSKVFNYQSGVACTDC